MRSDGGSVERLEELAMLIERDFESLAVEDEEEIAAALRRLAALERVLERVAAVVGVNDGLTVGQGEDDPQPFFAEIAVVAGLGRLEWRHAYGLTPLAAVLALADALEQGRP